MVRLYMSPPASSSELTFKTASKSGRILEDPVPAPDHNRAVPQSPGFAGRARNPWPFGSHLLHELPSPPPVSNLSQRVAPPWLAEVSLVAETPAGLISALLLEDFSSVGFDSSPNSLLRKGLKHISCVEITSTLWIAGQPVQKPLSKFQIAAI
jgi:hypothetical protein